MAEVIRPDYTFQWSSGGAVVAPSNAKIQTGWTAEVPPFQWENWAQNRQDNAITHLFQKGISTWSATQDYYYTLNGPKSYVQGSDGNIYVSLQNSTNQNPVSSPTYWKIAFVDSTALSLAGPIAGSVRNLKCSILAASALASITAEEIIVGVSTSGSRYKLSAFNKTINLASVGAGGMDTGTAPVSGFVAIYAIYNPTTQVSALLATNATITAQPNIYGGANMPVGYTASALISVWATNGSSQFVVGLQIDRSISIISATILTNSTPTANASFVTAVIPKNAVNISGSMAITSTTSSMVSMAIYDSELQVNGQPCSGYVSAGGNGVASSFSDIKVITPQTIRWAGTNIGTPTFNIIVSSYKF